MNDRIKEWLKKADADFATASREIRVADDSNFDAVCFHCQQCIEKLMKAALLKAGSEAPKVHDLAFLANMLHQNGVSLEASEQELRLLSQSAVVFRYPGESATLDDAKEVLGICERLRSRLLTILKATR